MNDVLANKKTEYNNKMCVFPSTITSQLNLFLTLASNLLLLCETCRSSH